MFVNLLIRAVFTTSAIWCLLHGACYAGLLASSTIEKCVRRGQEAAVDDCEEKIFTTLTLEGGQSLQTEELQYRLECVSEDGICPCACDYSVQASCNCRDLDGSLSIAVTKTAVSLLYPVTYARTVNYAPIEKAVYKDNCRDGALEDSPSCGWYLLDGQKVPDSQGFCCSCSSGQIWQETVGDARQATRAGLNCDYFADPFLPIFGKPPGSAHCLIYQPAWWEVYNVQESVMDFAITVAVDVSAAQDHRNTSAAGSAASSPLDDVLELTLTPSSPRGITAGGRVSAQLVGDLLPYRAFPVLTSQLLLMPALSGVPELNPEEWMLLDRDMVTLDGSSCGKIGVGFTAFRYQSEKCGRVVGSCLENQLPQLQQHDADRMRQGMQPQYLASRYSQAGVQTLKLNMSATSAAQRVQLSFPVPQITTTLVTLEVAADSLAFIQNAAPGEIVSARVCNAAGTACDSVAALNSAALVAVTLRNTGVVASAYTATFGNCSHPAQPVPAQSLSIDAGDDARVVFQFYMTTPDGAPEAHCTATLLDSQNAVTDEVLVVFSVNATLVDDLAISDGSREALTGDDMAASRTCRDRCGYVNLPCLIWRRCTAELASLVSVCLGALTLMCCCCYASRRGLLTWAITSLMPSVRTRRPNQRGCNGKPRRAPRHDSTDLVDRRRDAKHDDRSSGTALVSAARVRDSHRHERARSAARGHRRQRSRSRSRSRHRSHMRKGLSSDSTTESGSDDSRRHLPTTIPGNSASSGSSMRLQEAGAQHEKRRRRARGQVQRHRDRRPETSPAGSRGSVSVDIQGLRSVSPDASGALQRPWNKRQHARDSVHRLHRRPRDIRSDHRNDHIADLSRELQRSSQPSQDRGREWKRHGQSGRDGSTEQRHTARRPRDRSRGSATSDEGPVAPPHNTL